MTPRDLDPLHRQLAELEHAAPIAEPPDLRRAGATGAWRWALIAGIVPLALAGGMVLAQVTGPSEPEPSRTPSDSPVPTPEPTGTWELAHVVEPREPSARPPSFSGVQWFEGPGWIAYGTERTAEASEAGIWTSVDGLTWTPAELPGGLAAEDADVAVYDLTRSEVDGRGRFVAVVSMHGTVEGYVPARILVSDDGRRWETAATPDTSTDILRVAHGLAGFVAIGRYQEAGRVWRSSDGLEWTESAPDGLEQMAYAASLEFLGNQYVAIGFPTLSAEPPPLTTWTSADATTWSEHEVDTGAAECLFEDLASLWCFNVDADAGDGRMAVLGIGLGSHESPMAAISDVAEDWTLESVDDRFVGVTDVDVIEGGAIVAGGAQLRADLEPDAFIWVRDADSAKWRSVDWRAEAPAAASEIGRRELQGAVLVSVGPERTLILFNHGSVLLTSGRLP
jgi:hypothetical protein